MGYRNLKRQCYDSDIVPAAVFVGEIYQSVRKLVIMIVSGGIIYIIGLNIISQTVSANDNNVSLIKSILIVISLYFRAYAERSCDYILPGMSLPAPR